MIWNHEIERQTSFRGCDGFGGNLALMYCVVRSEKAIVRIKVRDLVVESISSLKRMIVLYGNISPSFRKGW